MTRPPWDPDPRYEAPIEPVRPEPSNRARAGCFNQAALTLACLAIVAVALLLVAAPRSAPDPTVPDPGASGSDVAPGGAHPARALADASGPGLSGAPSEDSRELSLSGRNRQPGKLGGAPPLAAASIDGTATWYCSLLSRCTAGYWPTSMVAAIDPGLGIPKGARLRVTHGDRSIVVRVVDVCACSGRRVIDLTAGAFRRLAPLSAGVIAVELEVVSRGTLPATDADR